MPSATAEKRQHTLVEEAFKAFPDSELGGFARKLGSIASLSDRCNHPSRSEIRVQVAINRGIYEVSLSAFSNPVSAGRVYGQTVTGGMRHIYRESADSQLITGRGRTPAQAFTDYFNTVRNLPENDFLILERDNHLALFDYNSGVLRRYKDWYNAGHFETNDALQFRGRLVQRENLIAGETLRVENP